MATSQTTQLIRMHNGICHYCKEKTNRFVGSPLQATKEHVVPRAFGGANTIQNYVLACADCNNKRGTALFFCSCGHCTRLIDKALSNPKFINKLFEGIIQHNRVNVFYQKEAQRWAARRGHTRRHFDTWSEAMDYAHNGTFMKGE